MQNPPNARKAAVSGRVYVSPVHIPFVISKIGSRSFGTLIAPSKAENSTINAVRFNILFIPSLALRHIASPMGSGTAVPDVSCPSRFWPNDVPTAIIIEESTLEAKSISPAFCEERVTVPTAVIINPAPPHTLNFIILCA